MIELALLGLHSRSVSEGRDISSLLAQPKRFTLLAYLAIGDVGGYHHRDTLAAMFWPDLDQFAARRALRNTVYHLRDVLGEGVIVSHGDEILSLDLLLLTSDVARLRDAVREGRYEDAVECYRGELLPGVHFANAGEVFEEWLSRERLAITALVMRAIAALTDREERAGNFSAASSWAQRGCALSPDDESWLRRAMQLLQTANDTGSALRLYESYADRLAAEFDAKPSEETRALAKRVRSGDGLRTVTVHAERSRPDARGLLPDIEPSVSVATTEAPPAPPSDGSLAPTGPLRQPNWRARRTPPAAIWLGALGAAAVLTVLVIRSTHGEHAHAPTPRTRVVIAVFENRTGDASLGTLGRMTQDWITQGVLRMHLVDVVDPHAVFVQTASASPRVIDPVLLAHHTGAGIVVSGTYYRTADTLLFQAQVTDVATGRILRVTGPIRSSVRTPIAGLNALRSRVETALASSVDVHATQSFDGDEMPPFDAYRDYVNAWDVYWHGDVQSAKALFLRAARGDSAFTAAVLGAVTTAANSNDCGLVDSLSHALGARAQSLDRADRLSLQIADARCRGRNDDMLRLTLERANLQPGNSSAQMSAAAAALWANRPQRALEALARVNPDVDLAWSTDTTHAAYWGGVTEALHMLGRHREELAAADRVPPGAPLTRIWFRADALAALSDSTETLALIDSSLALPVETASDLGLAPYTDGRPQYTMTPAWVANWISRELAFHGDTISARKAAARAVQWYRGRAADERAAPEERLVTAWSLEMLGDYANAEQLSRKLVQEDPQNVDFRGEL
ncbi:MAG TPA: BTAD domain-containing putative transcriptional regulator, partial [Gemmatimonadaceae bacterium]|nr:BTAD domain-containing putative transcriptional regulator [Gemmatimonadaceae bacterium]